MLLGRTAQDWKKMTLQYLSFLLYIFQYEKLKEFPSKNVNSSIWKEKNPT